MSFDIGIAWFNGIFLLLIATIPVITLIATRNPAWGDLRAHRYSLKARLPFGSEAVATSVRRHLRMQMRARMWILFGIIGVLAVLFLALPLRSSPQFLWAFTFALLAIGLPAASVYASVRARLFNPAPTAVRIARTRGLHTRDYLGAWRRRTPDVVLVGAVLAVGALFTVALATERRIEGTILAVCAGALVLAVGAAIADRAVERVVLARPQPASSALELAWDDSFRSDTLGWLRAGGATAALIPLGLASATLLQVVLNPQAPELITALGLFPWWAAIAIQLGYQFSEGQMPRALYPEQLGERPRLSIAEALA